MDSLKNRTVVSNERKTVRAFVVRLALWDLHTGLSRKKNEKKHWEIHCLNKGGTK